MEINNDLVVLVADGQMESAISGIISRDVSLGIRKLIPKIYVHPSHDPGCLLKSHEFLRIFISQYDYSIVIFDREGCGQEFNSRDELEEIVEKNLDIVGWQNRSTAIVIDPELEAWVWCGSRHVEDVLGWRNHEPNLYEWLLTSGYLYAEGSRIVHPKEAMEKALKIVGKQRSSSYYGQLAKVVSLQNCVDPSFIKLKSTLQKWFPSTNSF
jgi:hypothetical protein